MALCPSHMGAQKDQPLRHSDRARPSTGTVRKLRPTCRNGFEGGNSCLLDLQSSSHPPWRAQTCSQGKSPLSLSTKAALQSTGDETLQNKLGAGPWLATSQRGAKSTVSRKGVYKHLSKAPAQQEELWKCLWFLSACLWLGSTRASTACFCPFFLELGGKGVGRV